MKSIICEDLKTRYPTYKLFKVGFPIQFTGTVMDCERWPEGILVNAYSNYIQKPKVADSVDKSTTRPRPHEKN